MSGSLIRGLSRSFISFKIFNKAVFRWPALFIKYSIKNIAEYGKDETFKEKIESMPNWIPLKVRIISRTVKMAWHIANTDFSFGLVGMYRFTIMNKVVNDVVVSLIYNGMLSEKLIAEFSDYEVATKSGNFAGKGRVWDFYDLAYQQLKFASPYSSTLDVLTKCDFITRGIYDRYLPETRRLDNILNKCDALTYSESISTAMSNGYQDEYFISRVLKDDSISLRRLVELESKEVN